MKFSPDEVLFSITDRCNLACGHCVIKRSNSKLSKKDAIRFLNGCASLGIRRVGFTGGEPFLERDLLFSIICAAIDRKFIFDRIMTNGVWYKNEEDLKACLGLLKKAGYDGDICVSVDAFHRQNLAKVSGFIDAALSIWMRPDIISIASVTGSKSDHCSESRMKRLASLLNGRLIRFNGTHPCIKGRGYFIKILKIPLAPVGKAGALAGPSAKRWFKDDLCKGPGNVFFVEPSGDVKPCCGYAADYGMLSIGNIKDAAPDILKSISRNSFVRTVFGSGLGVLRKRLEKEGVKFPATIASHCYFCSYIQKNVPRRVLERCLDA